MTYPNNILQTVQVYNRSDLAFLQNAYCMIATSNKKFENFQNKIANLGSSTTITLPYRFSTADGLVASWQPAVQRTYTLTCDQAANTSYGFTSQQLIFNVDKDVDSYMDLFGRAAIKSLGTKIETNVALNATSQTPVYNIVNGQQVATGAYHTESGPDKFFGDGITPINSYQQLQQFIENFRETGITDDVKVYLPNIRVPQIIGSGLNQFVPMRNDSIANSWEIGEFAGVKYYSSNLLPNHTAGNVGNAASPSNQLTVVSTNDPTGANITQITCSGATINDQNALLSGDLGQFVDGVSGQPNIRQLTFIGNSPTSQPVQLRVTTSSTGTNNVPANGSGNVTFNIATPLQSTPGATQNISSNIVAGMKIQFVPSHKAGLIVAGGGMFLTMPRLPDQAPFPTSNDYDEDSGCSIRMTVGAQFGQNFNGTVKDAVWAAYVIPEYSRRICFPL